jgi:ABC-type sulfate transport system permease component
VARPSSAASITAKLGYDLFWTKGKAPTLWESVRNTLRDETVKQLLTIAGGVALAYLLLRLGLKQ